MVFLMLSNIHTFPALGVCRETWKELELIMILRAWINVKPYFLQTELWRPLRQNSNSLNLGISQYCKAAWLTNDIEMSPISLIHKIGWRVHSLHLADVKTSIISLQASEGEGHIVAARANMALNDLFHTEHFKLHCVGWSTNFSEPVTCLFKQSHSNFLCIPNVLVFTHQAGHSLPVGQHHCWLSHFHYCKEVKSMTVSELSRNDLQSFTWNLHNRDSYHLLLSMGNS